MKEVNIKIAFTTNLCAHYNVGTFETLSRYFHMDYYFYSAGDEWYWQKQHGVRSGGFHFEYLPGFHLGRSRITPTLAWKLFRGNYDVYIKCINGRFALPVTYLVARVNRKPFILWTGIWTRLQTPFHRLFFPLTRYIYRHSDAIVTYGNHTKAYLVSEGISPEKIFIATHVVKNELYNQPISAEQKDAIRQSLRIDPAKKVILYLGRLEEIKGLPYLFEAFARLNSEEILMVIAGEGSLRSALEAKARESGILDRVRFTGYVSPEESPIYYSIASVFVLPSITVSTGKELWGLVVNEAFNQGVPVIASDAVGAAAGGLVQDGINGFVFPEKDSLALSQALERILTDEDLRQEMSQNARQAIASWDYEANVWGYRQAIEYVIKRRSNPKMTK